MDNAWNAYEKAVEGLEVAQIQAAKAIASTDTVLTRAKDSLAAAQEALANLKAGPDPLDIEARENQAVLALATLQRAEADLAKLLGAPDPLEVEVKQKRVALAQASLAKAEDDLAGLQAGADPLEIAIKEVDVALAQLALTTALQRLEGATLKAPLAGTVSLVNVEAGQTVNASTAIVEIVDLTVVELNGVVDEIDVLFVQVGAQANVTMDALPGQVLQGTVSSIASAAQSQQGVVSYPIRIRLQLPEGVQLRQGLSATARVVIREERDVLMVPIQSLYGTFEQPVVRVMNNGRVEERAVVLGNSDDYWVAVRLGLDEGEQVVMDAQAATTSQLGILGGTMRQQMGSQFNQFQGQFPGSLPSGGFQRQR
ncbi:MAG: HlyD family efflux transporter periplasmic adaptor subunit [Chloroflexi bacterium]|nr:HlyD family efflux transporter periplasmic adaptor subunit [Chloroflexota bacterium]